MSDVCGTCRAPIVWALSPAGKRSPINEAATPSGNVLLLRPRGLDQLLAVTLSRDGLMLARSQGLPLHLNHWADCPDKAEWRERQDAKKRKAEGGG